MLGAAGNVAGPRWLRLFLPLNKPLVASNSAIGATVDIPFLMTRQLNPALRV